MLNKQGPDKKERPILFSGEMVRAILDGRKTQTRRVIKPQPESVDLQQKKIIPYNGPGWALREDLKCPYGKPGDRLYVKEAWCENFDGSKIHYKADGGESPGPKGFWRNPRFMFKKYARIWLEITDIRVERMQDIKPVDVLAEGLKFEPGGPKGTDPVVFAHDCLPEYYHFFITPFSQLWDSINKKRGYGWDVNPWVWVIEFKVIKP